MLSLLFACSPPAPVPDGALAISLEGAWQDKSGAFQLPHRDPLNRVVATHPLTLPADFGRSTRAVFRANALGWRAEVLVDGKSVGADVGGLRPIAIDLTGHLHGGEQVLTLSMQGSRPDNVWPGLSIASPAAWTYDQPRANEVRAMGEIWLEVGGTRRFNDLSVSFAGGKLSARALVAGAEGETVAFSVVRDGATLAEFPAATVKDGIAAAEVAWDGPLWELGGSETPFLQYVVATLPTGETRQLRFGARELAREGKKLLLNGDEIYLAVERFLASGDDPRFEMGTVAPVYARAGLNAMELHASMHPDAMIDAADELGLPVVLTPVCDGRRRSGGVIPVTSEWATFQAESNARVARAHRDHPSMVLWNIEANQEPQYPEVYAAYARSGIPAIDLRESLGYNDESYAQLRAQAPLPLFVNELAFHAPVFNGKTMLERVEHLLVDHRPVGIGLTVPNELTLRSPERLGAPDAMLYAAKEAEMLARSQVPPFVAGTRRGPAKVAVTVKREGKPIAGEVVFLRAPGQSLVAGATDANGAVLLTLDYAGPAEIGRWGSEAWSPVTLATGVYQGGRWWPNVAGVEIEAE